MDYATQDIYLASTLSALDFLLTDITQSDDKFIFHFDSRSGGGKIGFEVSQYWMGNILVDPKRLFSEFKNIKARMYDLKRSVYGKPTN